MAEALDSNEIPTCHGGLENLDEEHSYWIDEIEGTLPENLRGTFFRNGPGRQRIGDTPYGHWFDGDGMLSTFTFIDGRVHFLNRYVRTPKYTEETAAQEVLYRGFGTQIPGGLLKNVFKMPANPANTNTMWHGGHLLALNEGGKPYKLDPDTMQTEGEFTYDGFLTDRDVFSAHGKVHPSTGDYINFGAGISGFGLKGPKPCLSVYRIGPDGKAKTRGAIPLDSFPFCHDFAITEHYAVFFVGSIVFGNMLNVILGRSTISDQVNFDPNIPMQAIVCDLETLQPVKRFETRAGSIIHFGNAFEDGDQVVVDGMLATDFEANDTLGDVFNPNGRFGGGTYMRYRLNVKTGAMDEERMSDVESEFPTYNPAFTGKQHNACYTACSVYNGANSFFNGIQKVAFDGTANVLPLPPGLYGSEPLFAPAVGATAEDDGYLLEVVYDGYKHKSELQIYRAQNFEQVCSLKLRHHLPHQFHGHFTPDVFTRD